MPALVTRRSLLRSAAGGGAALAVAGLPAWARPVASAAAGAGRRRPDSLPFPHRPPGTVSMPEIDHVVVLMMENHSFDSLLGMVPHQVPGRAAVDGLRMRHGRVVDVNRDAHGRRVYARAAESPCQLVGLPTQSWNASHLAWGGGRNDGFVRASGPAAMRYWDRRWLPFTYSLVEHFPIGERYFASVLGQTYPNRRFLFCGTASGLTSTDAFTGRVPAANGTIFDRLDTYGVDWRIYYQDAPSALIVPGFFSPARAPRLQHMAQFYADAAAGRLPAFTFLDPNYTTTSEEDPQDIQLGERLIAEVVHAVMHGPGWRRTALFITWDEGGGYYDHVPPPRAVRPDDIAPLPDPYAGQLVSGGYDRYGFRVPLMVVSPWARPGYVSRVVQDHTSITAFVQRKWNLPAMTFRDANAHPLTDYFDFRGRAPFEQPPRLHGKPGLAAGLRACHREGLHPPLSEGTTETG